MRFIADGPDIPADLVAEQEKGGVLFVCGAGVSRSVGLPLFRGLVERIYGELHESWESYPAEREVMKADGQIAGQFDRMLRSLERRLGAPDLPRSQGIRESIRSAIRTALALPPDANLGNHAALLELSRDAEGRPRILTTNFDTLFERAWHQAHRTSIASHACQAMPRPRSAGFSGILHLHGRLEDRDIPLLGRDFPLEETDLVLTSAEFGDAYLRSGWASRYVYDLARTHVLVLVGYQAEDPPMRYLLEALEADRERYPDLKKVFAFAAIENGDDELQAALWRAKGIEPILYRTTGGDGHARLYDTLHAWVRYAEDPTAWRRERLRSLTTAAPADVNDRDLSELVALLDHGDAERILGEVAPVPAWLPVLNERGVFKSGRTSPGPWMARRIDDAGMVRASAAATGLLDDQARLSVRMALDQAAVLPVSYRAAWQLILRAAKPQKREHPHYQYTLLKRVASGDIDHELREAVIRRVQPRLRVQEPWDSPRTGALEEHPLTRNRLVWVEFDCDGFAPDVDRILKSWPADTAAESALLRMLVRALEDSLEEALDTGFLDGVDRASRTVPSVAMHAQNAHRGGFLPIVRLIADLWERVAQREPAKAREIAATWRASSFVLIRRLHLHALSVPVAYKPDESAAVLLDLDDRFFWSREYRRETMRLMAERWRDFGAASRLALARRIQGGVPRDLFHENASTNEVDWQRTRDHSIFVRFSRIEAAGGALDPESKAVLAKITACHPYFAAGPDDRDDFHSWLSISSGAQGSLSLLTDLPDDRLVREALRLQAEKSFEQRDIWRLLCEADPIRAWRGLKADADAGRWDSTAWRLLLDVSKLEQVDLQQAIVKSLQEMPLEALSMIADSAALWLRERRLFFVSVEPSLRLFFNLWDRLAEVVYVKVANNSVLAGEDLETAALNEAGGMLAWILRDALADTSPSEGEGFGPVLSSRFDRLACASGRSGILARVFLVKNLPNLYYVAPEWTKKHLIPRLSLSHPEAEALWISRLNAKIASVALFNTLKPHFLALFNKPGMSLRGYHLADHLLVPALWRRRSEKAAYNLSSTEIRRALAIGPAEVRHQAAQIFWRWMSENENRTLDRVRLWREEIGPLFREIWPKDAACRDASISHNLILMALECDEAFSDAVDAIVDFLVPHDVFSIESPLLLEERHQGLEERHPRGFLKLMNAIVDPAYAQPPRDLGEVLARCIAADPGLAKEPEYQRLYRFVRHSSS